MGANHGPNGHPRRGESGCVFEPRNEGLLAELPPKLLEAGFVDLLVGSTNFREIAAAAISKDVHLRLDLAKRLFRGYDQIADSISSSPQLPRATVLLGGIDSDGFGGFGSRRRL
jgi:hypothetical protein